MPAFASSRKKRKITASASAGASAGAGARLTQTELDAIAAPANESDGTNKYNLKYEPDDPSLTEEQRAQWRKEQRKARNRASAAASRHKTKARIDELEGEVGELKRMYAAAVARIAELEGAGSSNNTSHSNISASAVGFPTDFAAGVDRVTSTTISPPSSPPPSNIDDIDAIAMPPLDHFHVASSSSTSMMVHDSPLPSDLDHHHDHDDDNTLNAATAEKQHITGAASQPRNVQPRRPGQLQGQDQPSPALSSTYEPFIDFHSTPAAEAGYAGMAAGSSDSIVQALDGHLSSSSSSFSPAPSSPSLASTSSCSDDASSSCFAPSEEEEDELEEFLLDAFQGFEATEISAI